MLCWYGGALRWMQSNGGPLLLVPGEHLLSWEGTELPSGGRQIDAQFRWGGQNAPVTDYDRACDVQGWLGLLDIGAGHGLVLGASRTPLLGRPPLHLVRATSTRVAS